MSQLVRLSTETALEILEPKAYTPAEKELYIYSFEGGKFKHVLNGDTSTNTRDRSTEPYFQQVLLKPTPSFYFGEAFHTAAKFNLTHQLNYIQCKLHLANGYSYNPSSTYGLYFRMYFKAEDKEVTLISFIDTYNNSAITANTRELFLEGVGFSQSIVFDVLDVDTLLNNASMNDVKTALIDNSSLTSEILVDFALIENDQIIDFVKDSDVFQRLYLSAVHNVSVMKSDDQSELLVDFKLDTQNKALRFKIDHSKYNVQSYLSQYLESNETLTVNYDLSFEFYDAADNIVGSDAYQYVNLVDPFAENVHVPYIAEAYDHVFIELRATVININTGLRISRYANLLVPNPKSVFGQIPFTVNMSDVRPIHKLEVINRPIVAPNEMPRLVEIHKPVYIETAQNDVIVLHPVEANVRILLSNIDTKPSRSLVLKMDTRTYTPLERTQDYAVFKLPASEFTTDTTAWYILDDTGQMVTFGRVVRFTGEI